MVTRTFTALVQSGAGGTHPLTNTPITVYAATKDVPIALGRGTTGENGLATLQVTEPPSGAVVYVAAEVGGGVELVAVVGTGLRYDTTVVNELSTVAAAYSMAQFAVGTTLRGPAFGLRVAAGMCANLVTVYAGMPSLVLQEPPNGDQTSALRSLRTLGNLLAPCLRGVPGAVDTLLTLATSPGGIRPADTFQAIVSIARHPAHNAAAIYTQAQEADVFTPALEQQPDAWTLAVKVNDTGSGDYLFGGPANVAFDRNGYAWVANNVFQGTPDSGNFIVVLRPDGKPSDGRDGTPKSPVFGGGLQGPGWGVTVAPNGHAWVGNFGWGPDTEWPERGSASEFLPDGTPVSGEDGHREGGLHRAQATVADADGNIWMASFENGRVVVYLDGKPHDHCSQPAGEGTFGIAIAADGTAWVSASGGGLGWPTPSQGSVCRFRLEVDDVDGVPVKRLKPVGEMVRLGNACKAIAVDSLGNAWLASGGDSTVYQLSPDGEVAGAYTGVGGMDAPWGITVDGDDHVWVANFGALGLDSDFTDAGLTRLAGANPDTRPRGVNAGDPLSPSTGYTLPSGGDPVLLADGQPVYTDGTVCTSPLMRATSCQIDQAGNVWVVNNWKPRFATDFPPKHGNPGGDGVVIFVGLAKPPATRW